jgi:hypothetical protein
MSTHRGVNKHNEIALTRKEILTHYGVMTLKTSSEKQASHKGQMLYNST